MKKAYQYGIWGALAVLLCAAFFAHAAVPAVINYQSRLRTSAGAAITTATKVSFSLYSVATGGSALWTESYSQSSGACAKVRPDSNGYFSVQMGSCEAFPATLTFTTPLFLGVTIENDPEASPRVAFAPAPYAMNAVRVGNFVSDTSAGTLTGEPLGTATAITQGFNSSGLVLQGSGWNGSAAQDKGFKVRTTATDASDYRLSFLNSSDGSESVSILNSGRVGIGITNPQSELEVAGVIYANDFRTRGGSISTTGDGTNDLIRFTRPKLLIGHTADLNVVGPITNLMQLTATDVTFLENASFNKLLSVPSRQIKFGLNTFTFPVAAPASDGLVLTTDADGTLSWTAKSTGSVTSVGLSAPSDFTVSGSPVTASGTLDFAWKNQQPNDVLAGPPSGSVAGAPVFRPLASADIPNLSADKVTSGTLNIDRIPDIPSTKVTGVLGVANIPDLAADKITSGTFDAARIPALGASQIPDLSADKITSGTLNADRIPVLDIATKTSGTLGVTRGGTGIAATAKGDILFSDAINSLAALGIGSTGNVLTVNSAGLPVWSAPATNGTVTSVGITAPSSVFTVSGSPVTGSGDLALDLATQTKNEIFAAPVVADGKPSFRSLVSADIPDLTAAKITSGTFSVGLIPDLAADKITSGTFDAARIPALGVAQIPDLSADKITSGTLDADRIPVLDIATKTSGTLGVTRGGTGIAATAKGDILFSDAINSLAALGIGSTGNVLTVNSAGLPVWSAPPATGVTSVGLSMPSLFNVASSPVTASGTIAVTLDNQLSNTFFAGPAAPVAAPGGQPSFRGLVDADIPELSADKITSGVFSAARIPAVASSSIPDLDASKITSGVFNIARIPNIPAANITGVLASSSIPSLDASKIGSGVLGAANGGTGLTSVGADGTVLTSVGGVPAWTAIPAGLGGSGAFGRLAFWSAPSTLTSNPNIIIDNTNSRMAIGTSAAPATTLVVGGDTTTGGHVVPSSASAFDFGSVTKPARSVYSDNLGSATARIKKAYIDELYIFGGAGGSGTSTISATQTVFNGIAYNWPAPPIPSNDVVLTANTDGNLSWKNPTNLVPESGWRSVPLSGIVRLGVPADKVGIGTAAPATKLDVVGDIQATGALGNISAAGYLSSGSGQIKFGGATYNFPTTLPSAGQVLTASSTAGSLAWQTPTQGVGGVGVQGKVPLWTGDSTLGVADIAQGGSGLLIGTSAGTGIVLGNSGSSAWIYPALRAGVPGSAIRFIDSVDLGANPAASTITINGALKIPASAGSNKVLTSDANGNATWQTPAASGIGGSGTIGKVPVFSATGTIADSFISSQMIGPNKMVQIAGDVVTIGQGSLPESIQIGDSNANINIQGSLTMTGMGIHGAGKVLTSDANGNATWQMAAGTVGGSGTVNKLALFSAAGTISDSIVSQSAGTATVNGGLSVTGAVNFSTTTTVSGDIMPTNDGTQNIGSNAKRFGLVTAAGGRLNTLTVYNTSNLYGNTTLGNVVTDQVTVVGKFALPNLAPGAGKVLTSDAAGNATWQTPAATLPSSVASSTVLAGPIGAAGAPAFRQLSSVDIPALDVNKITSGALPVARGGTGLSGVGANGQILTVVGGLPAWASATTTFAASLLPAADNTYDLGSPTQRWRDIYVGPSTIKVVGANGQIIESIGAGSGSNVGKLVVKASDGSERQIGVLSGGSAAGSFSSVNISNSLQYPAGAGAGKVLTSDANGNATWQAPASGSGSVEGITYPNGKLGVGSAPAMNVDVGGAGSTVVIGSTGLVGTSVQGSLLSINAALTSSLIPRNTGIISLGGALPSHFGGGLSEFANVYARQATISSGLKLASGAGVGKVLTSDAAGNATWQTPAEAVPPPPFSGIVGANASGDLLRFNDQNGTYRGKMYLDGTSQNLKLTSNSGVISFGNSSTNYLNVNSQGISVTGSVKANGVTLTSDRRLKDGIAEISPVLSKLDALHGVNFTWKADKDKKKQLGVIAQDVEKSFPELVDTDSVTGMKSVNYSGLAAVAIQGVKELDAKIDESAPSAGEGIIETGKNAVTIAAPKASSAGKIFITPVGSTGGQTLYVGEVVEGKYFTVKTDGAVRSPVRFNWMIIK